MERSDKGSKEKSSVSNKGFWADDGNCPVHYPDSESAYDAAREYVESGHWAEASSTFWVTVYSWPDGDKENGETFTIRVDPKEPKCIGNRSHDWVSPHSVVGGCRENPGVWGHGGGVVIMEICKHCARYRKTNTWDQNPDTGEQGLESVSFLDPDQGSIDWVARQNNAPAC